MRRSICIRWQGHVLGRCWQSDGSSTAGDAAQTMRRRRRTVGGQGPSCQQQRSQQGRQQQAPMCHDLWAGWWAREAAEPWRRARRLGPLLLRPAAVPMACKCGGVATKQTRACKLAAQEPIAHGSRPLHDFTLPIGQIGDPEQQSSHLEQPSSAASPAHSNGEGRCTQDALHTHQLRAHHSGKSADIPVHAGSVKCCKPAPSRPLSSCSPLLSLPSPPASGANVQVGRTGRVGPASLSRRRCRHSAAAAPVASTAARPRRCIISLGPQTTPFLPPPAQPSGT